MTIQQTTQLSQIFKEQSRKNRELYLPHISIDTVVFGFNDKKLKVLVLKLLDDVQWSLPGGYVGINEDLNLAASHILKERTGADHIYLKQFSVFGELQRNEAFFKEDTDLWMAQRFISIGYYALVDFQKVAISTDVLGITVKAEWKDVDNLPPLMMDHRKIIESALLNLRRGLNYFPIGLNLLPEKFTMSELQYLYESILEKKLNRGNFYRKMMRYDILEKLDEQRRGGAHKAPGLYRFNLENYQKAMEEGFKESW